MNALTEKRERNCLTKCAFAMIVLSAFTANVLSAPTELATEPFALNQTIKAPPNIMFVLDDSGSMLSDYLPDWAGPYKELVGGVLTVTTPAYRFFNSGFNGVAYNPALKYDSPVMYTAGGSLDATTYPSQTGESATTGGNASATAAARNWRAVKDDGYGIQATTYSDLEGAAAYFITIPGEYCTAVDLRSCIQATAPSVSHPKPAPLRWCTTDAMANATTDDAGTNCQASRIDSGGGVTAYTYPRMPRPSQSIITVGALGNVTSIKVGAVEILSATASGGTSVDTAADIVAKINACTYAKVGACSGFGYRASQNSTVVTVSAPDVVTVSPVTAGSATLSVTAFSKGNVPGSVLFTVISPLPLGTSYPYPGSATKADKRTDCVGTTCTYAEEMTNYANWHAYYRTRMQMMKTAASHAFAKIDDKYRVGYFSINNGSGSDFLNVGAFGGSHRNSWYSKFFAATPSGATPLRTGLANAGKYYAHKLGGNILNTVAADDPLQYSCQKNYTILSTDGYWNDSSVPTQLDGTEIGQQDGNEKRPYYDGARQTRKETQTTRTDTQWGYNSKLVEQMTQQKRKTTTRVDERVTDTLTFDYEQVTSQLQKREANLRQTDWTLTATTRPLLRTPLILTETVTRYTQKSRPLSIVSNKLIETTTLARKQERKIRIETRNLKKTETKVKSTETPLIRVTSLLTETRRKLQIRYKVSYNGGDAWSWTSWSDAGATCNKGVVSPATNSGGVLTGEIDCQYVITNTQTNLDACTQVLESAGPAFSVLNAVQCQHQTATEQEVAGTFNDVNASGVSGNNYTKRVTYKYGSAKPTQYNLTACPGGGPQSQSGSAPYVGPARLCEWDTSNVTSADVTSGTCTNSAPGDFSSIKTDCAYTGTLVTQNNQSACTVKTGSSAPVFSVLQTVTCTRNSSGSSAWVSVPATDSCTVANTGSKATSPGTANDTLWETQVNCDQSGTTSSANGLGSCRVKTGLTGAIGTNGTVVTAKVVCSYTGGGTTSTSSSPCTVGTPSSGTANDTLWSAYDTCSWGAETTSGTNMNSCGSSGSGTGSAPGTTYTGPLVTCENGQTTSAANPACTNDIPAPPFTRPIKTCAYVPDPAQQIVVTECTPSATTYQCVWGNATPAPNQASCTFQTDQADGSGTFHGPARTCTYVDAGTTTKASCDARAKDSTTTGTSYPARDCNYGGWSGWSNVTSGNCEWRNQNSANTYYGPARQCQYVETNRINVGICNTVPGSSGVITGNQWSVLQKVDCPNTFPTEQNINDTPDAGTCTNSTVNSLVSTGVNRSVVTACTWTAPQTADAGSCAATGGESPPGTFNTKVECSITNLDPTPADGVDNRVWVPVEPTCTATGGVFDVSGRLVECRESDKTVYNASYPNGPVPVAPPCTGGADDATKIQTTCVRDTMPKTKPTEPVAVCANASPEYPHFVTTLCNTTTTTQTVMGCKEISPSYPTYQTVTCAWDATSGTINMLADVAQYYYNTDLRTQALGNCAGAAIPPATSASVLCSASDEMNNVVSSGDDKNTFQHMTTFTLGMGASGYMQYSDAYATEKSGDFFTVKGNDPFKAANGKDADPLNGVCSWQSTGHCNWPVPTENTQTTIDDLWHAGVNGRGAYFSARDPETMASSISGALKGVEIQNAVSSAATVSNPVLTPGDSYIFSGTYKTVEWVGDVMRITLDPYSGLPSTSTDWSAQSKLDAKDQTTRNIHVFSAAEATKLKPFTSANFASNAYFVSPHIDGLVQIQCTFAEICLSTANKANAAGANLVNYLRGDISNQEGLTNDNSKFYRRRTHVLGDIVNAQITYVSTPFFNYADPGYESFKTAKASREPVAYAAANDGMLHAIAATGSATTEAAVKNAANALAAATLNNTNDNVVAAANAVATATSALASDTLIGQELWAYIPSMVMPNLYRLADKKYQDKHRYYVDATPVVGDVCVSNCTNAATAVWKTILVGGLGRGGRGYYALDITDPATPKGLWEFTDTNLGYTYGTPQITKMKDGTWVVILTSGYNNIPNEDGAGGDGVGRIYVLNAGSGVPITGVSPISTGAGTASAPSGLVRITAPVVNPSTDATVIGIYGGDLLGNLWRFDINDEVGPAGVEAQLFATLKDGSGNSQPITTRPIVSKVQNKYIVMVGTGQYLAQSDSAVTAVQSLYGLVDHRENGTTASTVIYDNPGDSPRLASAGLNPKGFIMQKMSEVNCPSGAPDFICTSGQKVLTSTSLQVDYNTHNGWFVDLINASERANLDPALALGTLVFNTNAPSLNACDLGGKSYQYWLDFKTGGAITAPGNPAIVGKKIADALVNAPTIFSVEGGLRVGTQEPCVGPSCFKVQEPPISAEASLTRRTSWRELILE